MRKSEWPKYAERIDSAFCTNVNTGAYNEKSIIKSHNRCSSVRSSNKSTKLCLTADCILYH